MLQDAHEKHSSDLNAHPLLNRPQLEATVGCVSHLCAFANDLKMHKTVAGRGGGSKGSAAVFAARK